MSRRGQGELPADLREDGAYPWGACRDLVLDHLPAWPAGHVASHASGGRKELRENLVCNRASCARVLTCRFADVRCRSAEKCKSADAHVSVRACSRSTAHPEVA